MSTINLVLIDDFCTHHQIEFSFINALKENGLIEIISIEQLDSSFIGTHRGFTTGGYSVKESIGAI